MEAIVEMLSMEIPVFQWGEGYGTEEEEKRLLNQVTEFNNEQRHCNQNAASFSPGK